MQLQQPSFNGKQSSFCTFKFLRSTESDYALLTTNNSQFNFKKNNFFKIKLMNGKEVGAKREREGARTLSRDPRYKSFCLVGPLIFRPYKSSHLATLVYTHRDCPLVMSRV